MVATGALQPLAFAWRSALIMYLDGPPAMLLVCTRVGCVPAELTAGCGVAVRCGGGTGCDGVAAGVVAAIAGCTPVVGRLGGIVCVSLVTEAVVGGGDLMQFRCMAVCWRASYSPFMRANSASFAELPPDKKKSAGQNRTRPTPIAQASLVARSSTCPVSSPTRLAIRCTSRPICSQL